MHPVESILHAAMVDGTEDELAIAGEGAPLVAEFCVAELALALGMSTNAGKRYLGDAVETRYRLPRLWKRVIAGEVPVWKARQVATRTIILSAEAAGFVDQHVAPVAHRCSYAQIDRAVDHARDLYDPEEAEAKRAEAGRAPRRRRPTRRRDHRRTGLHRGHHRPRRRPRVRSRPLREGPRPARGVPAPVARRTPVDGPRTPRRRDGGGKELVIYAHHDVSSPDGLVRIENTRSWITVEQLGEWCTDSEHPGQDPAGARPQRAPAHRRLQAHPVAARAGHRDPPDLRVPALHQTLEVLRPRPHHRMAHSARPTASIWRRCAEDTTATRPTAAGPTNASARRPSCGAAPSARRTSEEADAPHPAAGGAIAMPGTPDPPPGPSAEGRRSGHGGRRRRRPHGGPATPRPNGPSPRSGKAGRAASDIGAAVGLRGSRDRSPGGLRQPPVAASPNRSDNA